VAGAHSQLAIALGWDIKGKISPVVYAAGIAAAWFAPWVANLLYASVALMWLIPDRRIERALAQTHATHGNTET
jgi:hypothetical protein